MLVLYVTISKFCVSRQWPLLKNEIFSAIMDFFSSNQPVIAPELAPEDTKILPEDSETVAMIKELLETRIRPSVQEDGGDIAYSDFKDGVVYVKLQGSCSSCPSSTVTLKSGIENMLMHYIPEVTAVEAVEDEELEKISQQELEKMEHKIHAH